MVAKAVPYLQCRLPHTGLTRILLVPWPQRGRKSDEEAQRVGLFVPPVLATNEHPSATQRPGASLPPHGLGSPSERVGRDWSSSTGTASSCCPSPAPAASRRAPAATLGPSRAAASAGRGISSWRLTYHRFRPAARVWEHSSARWKGMVHLSLLGAGLAVWQSTGAYPGIHRVLPMPEKGFRRPEVGTVSEF